jgi:outer membrane lipoprotein SlyB
MVAKRSSSIACLLAVATAAAGCASQSTFGPPSRANTAQVRYGEVVETRDIEIEGQATNIGRWGGASVGRAVGYTKGGDRFIAGAIGGVAGAIAGEAIERKVRTKDGQEITVRFEDDGSELLVLQEAEDDAVFAAGDSVRVLLRRDGYAQVSHR